MVSYFLSMTVRLLASDDALTEELDPPHLGIYTADLASRYLP